MKRWAIFLGMFMVLATYAQAQVKGFVVDSLTNERLPYITVYYEGKGVGCTTDNRGNFQIETRAGWTTITFSSVGYRKKTVKIEPGVTKRIEVQLAPDDILLGEVVVKPRKERYRRKNNPAVELMKRVIAHKQTNNLDDNDFYSYDKYEKLTLAMSKMTPERLNNAFYRRFPFLQNHVEENPETHDKIVPFSVQETFSEVLYRKDPKMKKTWVKGQKEVGISDLLDVGDMMTEVLQEIFADVNIYDNSIYMLKKQFVSPIANNATNFYQFFIMDTVYVERDKCFHLSFVPQNAQDFGFTGHLYILADSTYTVKQCVLQLPKHTGVNFVENLKINQAYGQLPNGDWALLVDDMSADVEAPIPNIQDVFVRRITRYSNHTLEPIAAKAFGNARSKQMDPDALIRDEAFWEAHRTLPLTTKENNVKSLVDDVEQDKILRIPLFIARLFCDNYIETTKGDLPSRINLGPISTVASSNYIDGVRLRMGFATTAHLHPRLFMKGYIATGTQDPTPKYHAEVEYSFIQKSYMPFEFPRHALTAIYEYEVQSPTDKFLAVNKDNIFNSFKSSSVDQLSYYRTLRLGYCFEAFSGFSTKMELQVQNDEPTGKLFYARNDGADAATLVHDINTTELALTLRYAPGEQYVNTKISRHTVNRNAPVFTVVHTLGVKGLFGSDYKSNLTEISLFKRVWLSSWGKLDVNLNLGAQWNKVPFPLLTTSPANTSVFIKNGTFQLMNNMEFLHDRFAYLDLDYDMSGKLFNRLPLIHRLKWREQLGLKVMYGTLTEKNNPELHVGGDDILFRFPSRDGQQSSFMMGSKPYVEIVAGVHNIFRLFQVVYVQRLTYLDNPNISRYGLRFGIKYSF